MTNARIVLTTTGSEEEAHKIAHTLVERGLHRVLAETKSGARFKLRRASFKGQGLQAELRGASWDQIRDLIYQDRGA